MKRFRLRIVALGVVTAWAVFAWAYLGVEDGSSGMSPLGWLHVVFFLPGGFLFQAVKGSHSNSDLPIMALASWIAYSLVALGIAVGVKVIRKRKQAEPNQGA